MRFHQVEPLSREELQAAFASRVEERAVEALISAAYYDPDWRWVQSQCLHFAASSSPSLRATAITCLGHLARVHRALDLDLVLPVLEKLADEPELRGRVEDTLDDIGMFLQQPKKPRILRFGKDAKRYSGAAWRKRRASG